MEGRSVGGILSSRGLALSIAGALFGVVLFSATIIIVSVPPVYGCWFTPAFAMPLLVGLIAQKKAGWWAVAVFLIGFTLAHWLATETADAVYGYAGCMFSGAPRCTDYALAQRALPAGFIAGWVGAALSFAMVAMLDARFRTLRTISAMGFAALVSAGIGAFGFSFGPLPHRQFPFETAFLLYLPWQTVFAGVLVWLFAQKAHQR